VAVLIANVNLALSCGPQMAPFETMKSTTSLHLFH